MNCKSLLHKGLVVAVLTGSLSCGTVFADEMYDEGSSSLGSFSTKYEKKEQTSPSSAGSSTSSSSMSKGNGVSQKPYLIPDALKATVFADSVTYKGFYLKGEPTPTLNSGVSILVDFEGYGFETQAMKDIANVEEAKKYIDANLKTHTENSIEVREMKLYYGSNDRVFFWVGDLSFDTLSSAKAFAASIDKPSLEAQIKEAEAAKIQREEEREAKGQKLEKKIIKTIDTIKPPLTPEYMSYGDTGWHTQEDDYTSGWWEHKLAFKGYEVFDTGQTADLFFTFTPSLSTKDEPWSSKLVVGIGIEYRPFKDDPRFDKLYNSWLTSLNTYVSYLHREPLKGDYNGATRDKRFGVGLYRDYNIIDNADVPQTWKDHFWGDVWGDASFRTTNFGTDPDKYDSWNFSVSAKMGFYVPKALVELNIMPYTILSAGAVDRGDFWSNTIKAGVGLRLTPFRNEKFKAYEWLHGLKLFAEYTDVVAYLKDDAEPGTNGTDVVIGIGYSHNRY